MKVDFDKKHPFTSVKLIPESEAEETLTSEQTEEFRKVGLRCAWAIFSCLFFVVIFGGVSLVFEITGQEFFVATNTGKILAVVGCVAFGCFFLSLALLLIAHRKLGKLSEAVKKEADEKTPTYKQSEDVWTK